MRRSKKTTLQCLAYISPWIVGFLCFGLFPLGYSLYMSFCSYNMIGSPVFHGLNNYIDLFMREQFFYKTFGNTFVFMFATTLLTMVFGLLFTMLLNRVPKLKRLLQTIYYLPAIMPFIAGTMLWEAMYAKYGILNSVLTAFNFDSISFMSYDNAMSSLIIMSVWCSIGGKITMLLPAVAGVPAELLESISLDGGGAWRKFRHIVLPMISPTIFYLLTMDIINGLQVYGPMMMLGGGTATMTVTLQIYNYAMIDRLMGYASAYAWLVFVIVLIVTFIFFRFGGRKVYYADGD